MALSVVILAAGEGKRMRSSLPKVLHKICGQEMLAHVIESALQVSDDLHIILYHQHDRIAQMIKERFGANLDQIHIHLQDHARYPGTGGALLDHGKPLATTHPRLLILNADMPLISKQALEPFLESSADNAIGVFSLPNKEGYGRVVIADQQVKAIIEQKDASAQELALDTLNAGVYLFSQEFLQEFLPKLDCHNAQKEYYLTQLITLGGRDHVITPIFVNPKAFLGVNSQQELAHAQDQMLERLRQEAMAMGVQMQMPHTIYLEKQVHFEGLCILEQGVRLVGNCVLKSAHIKAHSVIEESYIEKSDIGPLAHVRPKCQIVNSHIGNFVEIKNARLRGVKAGHLSYLGDCEIDTGSNIGAGVITCNYDGKAKHKTSIGKNVFIGSDTQLIAPLSIPDHVIIGAGSTVSQPVQEGDLVLSRPPQTNKAGGYYRFFGEKR
ncbi:bifunctional UDP-N-acetylglucosamine diphosphorylase/glucosamine-1-phosphate N-acetyltransferase GlmU [Helicobacter mehlei]|uniref:Bifunctional protein GlmU n=1 Tax=Helicobacter mehlei TaxID=2316080 RepID=A0A553V3Z9_9HELI|nr:bifunctional UDP-N-acetylglucosamine diphosphorylase/glucosamine-1-phosphate N-acetyltransferase GlmU [Helicobacter mehlei]TSA86941.1 bifunctional UDP-N-acetylglucosamine diphosphorylase/glucosamine-1-phosphate N-acetyltransferase GlmU [Helicobacter mehlei]